MTATQAPTPGPLTAAIDMLSEARDFIDRFSDVRDGDYGTSEPNAAMVMVHEINATIDQISAPTAPVEASGSVGLAASEIGAHIAKRDAEYEAALADLTITPDASSLDEFGRSIFGALSDCPAMSIDKQADFVARALWPAVSALSTTPARAEAQDEGAAGERFQDRCGAWLDVCFGPESRMNVEHRNARFLEEAVELVQASGMTEAAAADVVRYAFSRPQGEINQEVGGVMMTLAAHCLATGVDMSAEGERELARVWTKVDQIRAKEAAKPSFAHPSSPPAADEDRVRIAVDALEEIAHLIKISPDVPSDDFDRGARAARFQAFDIANPALAALKSTAAQEGGAK